MLSNKSALGGLVSSLLMLCSAGASAQDPAATEPAPVYMVAPAPEPAAPPPAEIEPADGPRFRFGIDFTGGFETVDNFSAWLMGMNLRLGVQLNDMIGIYAMPHFSGGKGTQGSITGSTGTFAVTGGADITLFDRIFFGAGFGYGIVNNPSGPVLSLRVGANPIVGRPNIAVPRRKAMPIGLDFRAYFTGGSVGTVIQIMATLGYESF